VNCAISVNITKAGWDLYHTVVRTTGRTLLMQINFLVTRPVHAADGRNTAAVLATVSSQPNE
jgi:hypothetical protein